MTDLRLSLRGTHVLWLSALAVVLALICLAIYPSFAYAPVVAAVVFVVAALATAVRVRSASLAELARRRRAGGVADIEPVVLSSRDGACVVWDGKKAQAFIELRPRDTFAVTEVRPDMSVSRPPIDVNLFKDMLVQGDIVLDSIELVTVGYRAALPAREFSSTLSQVIGLTPVPTGATTLVVVSLDTESSTAAITSRALGGSIPYGVERTVLNAAARIRILIEGQGIEASILTREQVMDVTKQVLYQVGGAADAPGYHALGDGETVDVRAFTPAASASAEDHVEWMTTPAWRTIQSMSISRDEQTAQVGATYTAAFVTPADDDVDTRLAGFGARPLDGQHMQVLSRVLPSVRSLDVDLPRRAVDGTFGTEFHQYPGGLGTYLGTSGAGRVFMRIDASLGQELHVVGPHALAQTILMRLSLAQVAVDVRMTGELARAWQTVVSRIGSPLVTYNSNRRAGVLVIPASDAESYRNAAATRIVVHTSMPAVQPEWSIVATGRDEVTVTTPRSQKRVTWSLTPGERNTLGLRERA